MGPKTWKVPLMFMMSSKPYYIYTMIQPLSIQFSLSFQTQIIIHLFLYKQAIHSPKLNEMCGMRIIWPYTCLFCNTVTLMRCFRQMNMRPLECNDAPHHQWRERFIGLEIATFVARPFTLGLWFTTPNLLGRKGVAIKTRPSQVYHWSFKLSPSRSNRDRWILIKDQNRVRGEFGKIGQGLSLPKSNQFQVVSFRFSSLIWAYFTNPSKTVGDFPEVLNFKPIDSQNQSV